ncbi:hypothetical protein BG000_004160, partial [Podila horticola]
MKVASAILFVLGSISMVAMASALPDAETDLLNNRGYIKRNTDGQTDLLSKHRLTKR